MCSADQTAPESKRAVWAGRVISGLMAAFLLFDSVIKLLRLAPALEGTVRLGFPATLVLPIGIILLVCVIVYVIPRTSVLGAILLTGYLGGATATQLRVQDPWFLFPVALGVLIWAGLYLRNYRIRTLLPLAG